MISNQITIPFWGHTSTESRIQEIIFTSRSFALFPHLPKSILNELDLFVIINCAGINQYRKIVLKNFILTVARVSAVVLLLRSEMKQSAFLFRRNVCHIRN
ncbi:hypothetical protein ACS0TY_014286 [Phlomoides rotata]